MSYLLIAFGMVLGILGGGLLLLAGQPLFGAGCMCFFSLLLFYFYLPS